MGNELPVIDLSALRRGGESARQTGRAIHEACREIGFFYVVGHGVDRGLRDGLDRLSRTFFSLSESQKAEIAMAAAGRAWRGWFPVGAELTSGIPDEKEGIYFGAELTADHPKVRGGVPMHGANQFPREPVELKDVVLRYLDEMTGVGQTVLSGIASGLGLESTWFADRITADPLALFRIFRYPAISGAADRWSVGEHTDYGLLTLVAQDETGGLQVKTPKGWTEVKPLEDSFVCNLGDMLDHLTGGLYRSTPHRVLNRSDRERLSFPFFLDPSWNWKIERLPVADATEPGPRGPDSRWDHANIHGIEGTYGEYILKKVGKVFPDLFDVI